MSPVAPLLCGALLASGFTAGKAAGLRGADVEQSLLSELVALVSEDRPGHFEEALGAMFVALPKNARGNLEHQAARYALHRLFVQRHGWFIKGLEPGNDTWHVASPPGALSEWVPSYLQHILERRLHSEGLNLRELAALAAALEDLVHKDVMSRLEGVFRIMRVPTTAALSLDMAQDILHLYLVEMLGGNISDVTPKLAKGAVKVFAADYPGWKDFQKWLRPFEAGSLNGAGPHNFQSVERVLQDIGEKYAIFNQGECRSLKKALLEMESRKAGRVKLSDFYNRSMHSHWNFDEKVEYLRALGALDESEPSGPAVIVPNYVAARPNCLEASNLVAICCLNECEDLMGHLESEVGGPTAAPGRLLEMVGRLSTETLHLKEPRVLSPSLVRRLEEVAAVHAGQVPLHSRLFSQWMHHAFPRECPYPHEAGKVNPMTPDEWMRESGHNSSKASDEEMRSLVSCNASEAPAHFEDASFDEDAELQWSEAEELLMLPAKPRLTNRVILGMCLMQVAAFSLCCGVHPCGSTGESGRFTRACAAIALGAFCASALAAQLLDLTVLLLALAGGLAMFTLGRVFRPSQQACQKSKGF